MYDELDIAIYVIHKYNELGIPINNFGLNRVLYFLQGSWYILSDSPLITSEFVCWKYGPVLSKTYEYFRSYDSCNISVQTERKIYEVRQGFIGVPFEIRFASENHKSVLDKLILELSQYSFFELSGIARKQQPWINNYIPRKNSKIRNEEIRDYFRNNL